MFSFKLEDESGLVVQTVQNDGGTVSFEPLVFNQDDIGKQFTYVVTETAENKLYYTMDDRVYVVTVHVEIDADGQLTARQEVRCNGEVTPEIVFNNMLEAPLTISKKVTGCQTEEAFAITICFFNADGTEMTAPVSYAGDLVGELTSGESIRLAHGQSVTFSGLLPGMCYTVEEEANIAFTTTLNGLPVNRADGTCTIGGNRADFVNTLKTTIFSVRKSWEGGDGGDIILTLYADGEKLEPQPAYIRSGDTYTYTGLPMYDADGDQVVYSAKEKYMDGYLTIYDNVFPYEDESRMIYNGGTIINRAVTSIRVRKIWSGLEDGETPPEITLTLYCNGEAMNRKQPAPDDNGWYTYKNLPRTVRGETAVYHVMEEPMTGYRVAYADAAGQEAEYACDGYTITNHKIPATGDNAHLMLWTVMLTASAAVLLMQKRRSRVN